MVDEVFILVKIHLNSLSSFKKAGNREEINVGREAAAAAAAAPTEATGLQRPQRPNPPPSAAVTPLEAAKKGLLPHLLLLLLRRHRHPNPRRRLRRARLLPPFPAALPGNPPQIDRIHEIQRHHGAGRAGGGRGIHRGHRDQEP